MVGVRPGHALPAGHAVLSLTTVGGESAPRRCWWTCAAETGTRAAPRPPVGRTAPTGGRPTPRAGPTGLSPLAGTGRIDRVMPPTLASLVQHPALKLTVLAGGRTGSTPPVRWVHTSELDDPTPYLEGGELLLTTGLKLGRRRRRTRCAPTCAGSPTPGSSGSASASASGTTRCPQPLVDAAARARAAAAARCRGRRRSSRSARPSPRRVAADQYQAVTAGFEAQRELTRAALAPDGTGRAARPARRPPRRLGRALRRLRRRRRRRAPTGRAAAPPGSPARSTGCATAPHRPAPPSPDPTAARTGSSSSRSAPGGRPRGFLAVGTEDRLDTADALRRARRRRPADPLPRAVPRPPGRRTAAGRRPAADAAGRRGRPRPRASPDSALRHPARPPGAAADRRAVPPTGPGRAADPRRRSRCSPTGPSRPPPAPANRCWRSATAHRLIVLAAADGARAAPPCADLAEAGRRARPPDCRRPSRPTRSPRPHRQAERALAVALRRGRSLVEHDEVGAGSVLPLLADDAVRAFAEGLLRPLREHDATSRGDLVASLRAWLSRHGQWDAAAADLGRPPAHAALPDAPGRGDPRPLAGRPGRADGAVARAQAAA